MQRIFFCFVPEVCFSFRYFLIFSSQLWFSFSVCESVLVSYALRMCCWIVFFFSSILCKAAHEVFVQHSSFTVFFFFVYSCLDWCFNVLHFCYALCSRKCECVRECSCSSSCESPQNHTSRKSVAGADCDPTFWPSTWVYIVYIIIIYIL